MEKENTGRRVLSVHEGDKLSTGTYGLNWQWNRVNCPFSVEALDLRGPCDQSIGILLVCRSPTRNGYWTRMTKGPFRPAWWTLPFMLGIELLWRCTYTSLWTLHNGGSYIIYRNRMAHITLTALPFFQSGLNKWNPISSRVVWISGIKY